MTIATLAVGVVGDTSGLHSAMLGATQDVDRFEAKTKSADKSGGDFFGGLLGGAAKIGMAATGVMGLASGVAGLASGFVSGNAAFEDYNTRFTVLLGSADKAKERMAALAKFGATTPFDLPGVVEADTILQGFGLHSTEAAQKFGYSGDQILKIAGNVASGTGAGFDEMTNLIGKFSAGATGEAISRMQELGITTRDQLTQMGLKFSSSGQLLSPLPEAMSTVLKVMDQKYNGLMDKQSTTFNGMISNAQDWVGNATRTMAAPIFAKLETGLQGALTFMGSPEVMGALSGFADMLSNGIGQAVDFAGRAFSVLMPIVSGLFSFLAAQGPTVLGMVQGAFNLLAGPIQLIGQFIGGVVTNFQTFFGAIAAGQSPLAALASLIGSNMASGLQLLQGAIGWIGSTGLPLLVGLLGQWVPVLWGWVEAAVPPLLAKLGEFAGQVLGWIGAQAPVWGQQALLLAGVLWQWVQQAAPPLLAQLGILAGQLFTWIGAQAQPLLAQFGAWAGAFVGWVVPAAVQFLQQWPGMLSQFLDWIGAQAGPILGQLGAWALSFIGWVAPMIPPLLLGLAGVAGGILAFIAETVGTLALKLGEWGLAFLGWVGSDVLPFIGQKLGEFGAAVWGWLSGPGLQQTVAQMLLWAVGMTRWVADNAIPAILGFLGQFGAAVWGWITGGGLASLVTNIQTWEHGLIDWVVQDAIPGILAGLANFGSAVGTWITGGGAAALVTNVQSLEHALVDWVVTSAIPGILAGLAQFGQSMQTWTGQVAGQVGGWAAGIGQGLITGLVGAIQAGAGQVIQAITGVASGAIDAAKNLLGIHSPSDETQGIGDQMIAGWVGSLTAGAGQLQTAITGVATVVLQALQTGLAPVQALWAASWAGMAAAVGGAAQGAGGGQGAQPFIVAVTAALGAGLAGLYATAMATPLTTGILQPWQAFWMGSTSPMLQAISSATDKNAFVQKTIDVFNTFLDVWYFTFMEPRLNAIIQRWLGWWTTFGDQSASMGEQVGLKTADGIALGITEHTPAIEAAATQAVQRAIDAANQAAGNASPSKEGIYIGRMIGAGMVVGMGQMEGAAATAGGSLAGAALTGASPTTGGPATTPTTGLAQSIQVVIQLPDGTFMELEPATIRVLDYEAGYAQRATGRLGR